MFHDDRPDRGGTSAKQAVFLQQRFLMRYARLGPSSVLVRVLITELGLPCRGFTPPFRVQGWATHFSSSKQQQAATAAAGGSKVLATAPWLKTGIQVAQNDRGAKAHHHKQVSLHFEPFSLFYGRFSVQKRPFLGLFSAVFRTIVLKVQDDRRYAKQVFLMRTVVLSWRLGYQMMANGCSIRHIPCRGATRWSILR